MALWGYFSYRFRNISCYFPRHSEMLASKQHYLGRKHGNFSYVIKAKCFSFHGLRKCVASKEQHIFLIRENWSLTAQPCKNSARLDVQCCRNSAWYGVQWCRNSARFDVQCCRNSARLDVQCCRNSARLDVQCCRNSAHLNVQCCRNSARYDVRSSRNSAGNEILS